MKRKLLHMIFINHKDTRALSRAARLWTIPAKVFDRNRMSPRYLFDRNAYGSRQPLPLERTRGVVTAYDGFHQLCIQFRRDNQLIHAHAGFFQVARQGFHNARNVITAF